jgi:hypothetical protein
VYNNGRVHSKPIDRLSLSSDPKTISMYNYIPAPIRQEFEKTPQKGIEAHVDLPRGRKVHIYMLEPADSSSRHESITTQLNNVVAWFRYISTVAAPRCAKDLSVYILATDLEKVLPSNQSEPIDQIHANTAFTTSCSAKNEIFIFRREEWFKVLIHETFHCLGLDFSADFKATDYSNQYILSIFPALDLKTDVRLYETFCETWAELVHLAFRLFVKGNDKGYSREFSAKQYREALSKEQVFSIVQSNKLLRRAGFKLETMLDENPDDRRSVGFRRTEGSPAWRLRRQDLRASPLWPLDAALRIVSPNSAPKAQEEETRRSFESPSEATYKENTQAFSYYVLKSALLYNANEFLSRVRMQFDPSKIADYCLLVKQSIESEKYRNAVQHAESRGHCGESIRKTLRMTSPL